MASSAPEPAAGPATSVGADASRTVLGRGALYTLGTAAPVLANALVTPYVTRSLDPRAYGVVANALVVVQVGMILAGLGLAAAITRHGILERSGVGGARGLVLRGAGLSLVLCVVVVAGLVALRPGGTTASETLALQLAVLAAGGFAVVVNTQSYLRVLDRPAPFVALALTGAVGGPLVGIALIGLVRASAASFTGGLAVGYAVAATAALLLTLRGGERRLAPGDLRRALQIGLPTVPHQVALYLASGVLVLVATAIHSAAASGRLQVAVLVGSAPGVITSSLNNAWAPVVYRTSPEHRAEVLERTGRDIGFLTALGAGLVVWAAPLLLALVAPASFDRAALVPAVALVAAGTVLSVPYLCNVHLVFVSGRSTGLAVVTPASLLLGTLAAAAASAGLGVSATAVGMTVTYAALALGTALLARRVDPTRWRWSVLVAPCAAGFALCLLGGAAPVVGGWLVLRAVVAALLAAAALGALLRLRRR